MATLFSDSRGWPVLLLSIPWLLSFLLEVGGKGCLGCEVIVDCLYPWMTITVTTKKSVLSRFQFVFIAPPLLVHQTSGGPRSLHSPMFVPCSLHSSNQTSYHFNLSTIGNFGFWLLGGYSMLKYNRGFHIMGTQNVCTRVSESFYRYALECFCVIWRRRLIWSACGVFCAIDMNWPFVTRAPLPNLSYRISSTKTADAREAWMSA